MSCGKWVPFGPWVSHLFQDTSRETPTDAWPWSAVSSYGTNLHTDVKCAYLPRTPQLRFCPQSDPTADDSLLPTAGMPWVLGKLFQQRNSVPAYIANFPFWITFQEGWGLCCWSIIWRILLIWVLVKNIHLDFLHHGLFYLTAAPLIGGD